MHGTGRAHRRQGQHRLFPALVAAILVHIAVFSGWPSLRQPAPERHSAIHLQLQAPSRPADRQLPRPRATGTAASAPDHPAPATVLPATPTSLRKTPRPQPSAVSLLQHPPQSLPTPAHQGQIRETRPSADSPLATRTTLEQITLAPAEQDPYQIKLATHLARELEQINLPALSDLPRPVTMEIELQLMTNGALTRARILKPTGIRAIDDSAYQASLAASPYPEPPATESMLNRFGVTLVFSPKRI